MDREIAFGTILKAAVIAGVLAGVLVAGFHFAFTEYFIDQAIAIEESRAPASTMAEEPVVSRPVQRAGLFLGYLIYGLSWSLLFAVAFQVLQKRLPATTAPRRGLLLALAAYWAVALLPFLKYPANPPGVGDPETIAYRQGMYLVVLMLGVGSAAIAVGLGRWIGATGQPVWASWATGIAIAAVSGVLLFVGMPASPDAVQMPLWVVSSFRTLSLVGATLFWIILGVGFAVLINRANREPAQRLA